MDSTKGTVVGEYLVKIESQDDGAHHIRCFCICVPVSCDTGPGLSILSNIIMLGNRLEPEHPGPTRRYPQDHESLDLFFCR